MVWYGMVWYGMVWYGMVGYGMVWYGVAGMDSLFCLFCIYNNNFSSVAILEYVYLSYCELFLDSINVMLKGFLYLYLFLPCFSSYSFTRLHQYQSGAKTSL